MFLTLLGATFVVALIVSTASALIFRAPISGILRRLIQEDVYRSWERYLYFALYVVGISSGVRIWQLERYINPNYYNNANNAAIALTLERWVLEIYSTVISTLQGIAWMLLVFFMAALAAFVLVKITEIIRSARTAVQGAAK